MSLTVDVKKLLPAPGYVLVEPLKAEKQTASGLYLPDSHAEKPQMGTILAVGDEAVSENGTKIKASFKKSDVVVYKKWGGNEFQVDKVEYQFLKFEDVLAVVKN